MTCRIPLSISAFVLLAATLFVFPGCTDPLSRENDALRQEIIVVHDEAMEKIGLIYELQKELKAQASCSGAYEAYVNALAQADESMFAWMRQYRTLAVDGDLAGDNRYRREQLEQIRAVQQLMEEAIGQAQRYLETQIPCKAGGTTPVR